MLNDPENVRNRATQFLRKVEIFALLGNKCSKCGFADLRALQIDHIKGGGSTELYKNQNKRHYYKLVLASVKAKEGKYQLLCANCNWIKRWEKNEGASK